MGKHPDTPTGLYIETGANVQFFFSRKIQQRTPFDTRVNFISVSEIVRFLQGAAEL